MIIYWVFPEYYNQIEHRTDGVYRKILKQSGGTGGFKVIAERKIIDYSGTGNSTYLTGSNIY